MDYTSYEPLAVAALPAAYITMFRVLDLTFTPANDTTRVRTITGHVLQLETAKRTKRGPDEPIVAIGYQMAIWELREGHLRWCPEQGRLWRRDEDLEDHPGERRLLNSWHAVKRIEDEYGVSSREERADYAQTILREAQRPQWFAQVERGVRVGQQVWVRRDGRVVCVDDEPDLAVTQTFTTEGVTPEAVAWAMRICQWLTVDERSCKNLIRMFATPWLEPFKQFTYVLSGHGGDGKTLIVLQALFNTLGAQRVYPAFNTAQFCAGTGYSLAREGMVDAMDGMSFAYDDEAGAVSEEMLPWLRSLSTGTQMQARVVGGKYRTVTPSATIVLCTNQQFADSTENSDRRRFVKVEFHANTGRSFDEYHAIEDFIHAHPAALYLLSCMLWEQQGDVPEIVNLSPARAISDEMFWLISEISDNEESCGQAIASRGAFRKEFHRIIDDSMLQVLGLENSTTRALDGVRQRVVRVADWDRFEQYRRAVLEAEVEEPTVAPPPVPLEDAQSIGQPSDYGFECDYVRADSHKVARNWKQQAESPNLDTSVPPEADAFAVIPRPGYVVLDLDVPRDGGMTGWQLLNERVGAYGSRNFPRTWLVGSPSGGVHAYYRVPAALQEKLKNSAHPKNEEFPNGIPVDLRVDGKGYVIGAGSHVESGDYRLLDVPDDQVPELSHALCQWLTVTPGYRVDESPSFTMPRQTATSTGLSGGVPSFSQLMAQGATSSSSGEPRPDMTPIPEGSRNNDLHAWAYGRAVNHPENLRSIELDLYERARVSGLPESEVDAMWKSILRQIGARA